MSFNRRGPPRRDSRPDRSDRSDRYDRGERGERDQPDRPPYRRPGGDWQPRDARPGGGGRGYPPRGGDERGFRPRGADERPPGRPGADRPYAPRRFTPQDEGGMSIRLDPRRLTALKHLAGEAGTRPGELVRQWVEERIDAERRGEAAPAGTTAPGRGGELEARVASLADRVAALEAASGNGTAKRRAERGAEPTAGEPIAAAAEGGTDGDQRAEQAQPKAPRARGRKRVSAKPSGPRVALHDEITAVIAERGPLPASEIAESISERGRYTPPRSGKPLDAATVNARVSNPTYRARFTRSEGRIGLAEPA